MTGGQPTGNREGLGGRQGLKLEAAGPVALETGLERKSDLTRCCPRQLTTDSLRIAERWLRGCCLGTFGMPINHSDTGGSVGHAVTQNKTQVSSRAP